MRKLMGLGLVMTVVTTSAMADVRYQDYARVLAVTPQVERVNAPRQECRTDYVRESVYENHRGNNSNAGAIIGGVAGGLLGSTIGKGSGKVVAAAVGAGVGAIVGNQIDNRPYGAYGAQRERVVTRPVETCMTVDNWQTVTSGYLVQYDYQGRQYSTVMDRDPGPTFPVTVAMRPQGGYASPVAVYNPPAYRQVGWRGHDREHQSYRHHRDYW